MNIGTLNDHCLNPLLNKVSKKANKTIFLLGSFNIELSNLDTSKYVSTFLDDLPTRMCNNSKTLTDIIFCNIPNPLINTEISGNISSSVSDHFPQCFLVPTFFSNSTPTKYNIISDECKRFNEQSLLGNYRNADWNKVLQISQNNVN